jgi:serine/threonine-protein kinase
LKLIEELKARHFVQLLGGYLAAGWIVLEVISQLTENGVLPALLYRAALTLVLSGIPAVGIRAWYHGARGDQKGTLREYAMLGMTAVLGLAVTGYVVQRNLAGPADLSASALDRLDPWEDPRRIAVTYFEGSGANDEAELLGAGLTESLIDVLARVPQIHVVSRNGVAPLRGRSSFPTDSVSRALGVGILVRGRVSESDSVVTVRVEVVRTRDDRTVDSKTFSRPRSELFELQDQIAAQVALFLRETIGPQVKLVADEARTENVDAWLKVQEAAELTADAERLKDLRDIEAAHELIGRADSVLAEAERLSPDWSAPPTHRGFLDYYMTRWDGFDRSDSRARLARAVAHANQALALDPKDADALFLRGTSTYWGLLLNLTSEPGEAERLMDEAEADFHAATAANPSQASAYSSLSHLFMRKGEAAQAKLAAERSYEADPWLTDANLTLRRLFDTSLELQDEQEAWKWCDAGTDRFPEDFRFRECRVWRYALPGNPERRAEQMADAWTDCGAVSELSPESVREYNRKACEMALAMGLVRAGLPDSARAVARRARAGPGVDPVRDLAWLEAIVLTWLGDYDDAVDRLATYMAVNPGSAALFAEDETWWLEELRSYPGYQRLVGTP